MAVSQQEHEAVMQHRFFRDAEGRYQAVREQARKRAWATYNSDVEREEARHKATMFRLSEKRDAILARGSDAADAIERDAYELALAAIRDKATREAR